LYALLVSIIMPRALPS